MITKVDFKKITARDIWASHSHIFEWDINEIEDPIGQFAGQMGLSREDASILHEGLAKGESLNEVKPRLEIMK